MNKRDEQIKAARAGLKPGPIAEITIEEVAQDVQPEQNTGGDRAD